MTIVATGLAWVNAVNHCGSIHKHQIQKGGPHFPKKPSDLGAQQFDAGLARLQDMLQGNPAQFLTQEDVIL